MFSLTLGLMGLDELHLRVLAASTEDTQETQDARKGEAHSQYFDGMANRNDLNLNAVIIHSMATALTRSTLGSCGRLIFLAIYPWNPFECRTFRFCFYPTWYARLVHPKEMQGLMRIYAGGQ